MANYVFENMSQAQADALVSTDSIAFFDTTVTASSVAVSISTQVGTPVITLTAGAKSLTFNAAALSTLSDGGRLSFNDSSNLLLGTNGADTTLTGTGTTGDTVYLFGDADAYTATAGPSNVYAGTGADTVTAGAGSSNLFGGDGADSLTGGAGNDHIYGQSASGGTDGIDNIVGGAGGDYINGNADADIIDGGADSDRILGGNGADTISGSGGNDTVNGNLGNDTIDGGADNDSLRGGQGNDVILGSAGSDNIQGDLGTDTVNGGADVDFVTGGDGADNFNFTLAVGTGVGSTTKSYDTVNDFVDGEDEFRITGATTATAFGQVAADVLRGDAGAVFTTVAAATTYAQELLDANASGADIAVVKVGSDSYLFYASSGVDDAAIDSIIKVQGVSDVSLFTNADFTA